ncbi:MAG: polyprenyl synthetase family protein [Flavobacteriales bacterium]|nr:polyprenyl synthetase family protein [Flavobacteriales bacterium]MCX7769088.1 polyprenyl synthetase family protein [Flavobacteriales bacterium]MDW8410454.1 polyprenyl synthetase family protein [Flavobacteriales bacterium]
MSAEGPSLRQIQAVVKDELRFFDSYYREVLRTRVPLLDLILRYMLRHKGKQLRPLMVYLCAGAAGGITRKTHTAAVMVELLHNATLVHDDVVDDSMQRRGFFSINALWKNKIAVLAGDFLLSRGLTVALDSDHFDLLRITARSVKEMAEGELLQLEKARRLDITEEVYFEIIRRKTASLMAACCACGAASATDNPETIEFFRRWGELAGMAFQIKDDLLDYTGDSLRIGKPKINDLKEKKMTLPLIYALGKAEESTRRYIIGIVKRYGKVPARVEEVLNFIRMSGGPEYAEQKMLEFKAQAEAMLESLNNDKYTEALRNLFIFILRRDH